MADEGASLYLMDVQKEALELTIKECREKGADVDGGLCDVSKPDDIRAAVAAAVDRFGGLDVLCNVAGILRFDHTHELSLEDWNRILQVNLTGTFLMCQAAIPHLLERGGNIVNISSTAALAGQPWAAAYSASKGGVLALTASLAVEYGKQGLRANALCPGSILTPIQDEFHMPEGADAKLLFRIMPLDKMRGPETVAGTLAFVASEDGAHINGEDIRIDGGCLS